MAREWFSELTVAMMSTRFHLHVVAKDGKNY